jgi:hypothetical protein
MPLILVRWDVTKRFEETATTLASHEPAGPAPRGPPVSTCSSCGGTLTKLYKYYTMKSVWRFCTLGSVGNNPYNTIPAFVFFLAAAIPSCRPQEVVPKKSSNHHHLVLDYPWCGPGHSSSTHINPLSKKCLPPKRHL